MNKNEFIEKLVELVIMLLFASSAIAMAISQDYFMKSVDMSNNNLFEFQRINMDKSDLMQGYLQHLTACNILDMTKFVQDKDSSFPGLVEAIKDYCINKTVLDMSKLTENYANDSNSSMSKILQNKQTSDGYKQKAEEKSFWGYISFLAASALAIIMVVFKIIRYFKEKQETSDLKSLKTKEVKINISPAEVNDKKINVKINKEDQ